MSTLYSMRVETNEELGCCIMGNFVIITGRLMFVV
jgi:hypothetical protein